MKSAQKIQGFTLIELLVVIAVIGILAAVVLASLGSARGKGKDSAVRTMALQMRSLMELELNETGSYNGLKTNGWVTSATVPSGAAVGCDDFTSVNYKAKMQELCVAILNKNGSGGQPLWINDPGTAGGYPTKYSIMVYLAASGYHLCVGSNGKTSAGPADWTAAGCYQDPSL